MHDQTKAQAGSGGSDEDAIIKIKTDALRLLAFRPRSIEELRKRLKMKRYPEALISETLERLKAQGFLDDEKFARLYAGSKISSKPTGKRQLEFELRQKGVSEELAKKTIANLKDYDEKEEVRRLVESRLSKSGEISIEAKKRRLFAFLRRRGFSSEAIFSAMEGCFKDHPENFDE